MKPWRNYNNRRRTYLLTYLITARPYVSLRILASLITDARSSLSAAFYYNLFTLISRTSFSKSSNHLQLGLPLFTSLTFTLKYFLTCPSLIHSYYTSNLFQPLLLIYANMLRYSHTSRSSLSVLFLHIPCTTTVPCNLLNIFLFHLPSLFISTSVKILDGSMLRSIAYVAIGPIGGKNFCWKAFWDLNQEWSN